MDFRKLDIEDASTICDLVQSFAYIFHNDSTKSIKEIDFILATNGHFKISIKDKMTEICNYRVDLFQISETSNSNEGVYDYLS